MRVMLDDMDLTVRSRVIKNGHEWEGREVTGKIQHCLESINFHPAGVGHILLTTIKANFLDQEWCETWCMVYTITKYWGGYLNFGAWFLKIIFFQHKKIKSNGVLLKIKQIIRLYSMPWKFSIIPCFLNI